MQLLKNKTIYVEIKNLYIAKWKKKSSHINKYNPIWKQNCFEGLPIKISAGVYPISSLYWIQISYQSNS